MTNQQTFARRLVQILPLLLGACANDDDSCKALRTCARPEIPRDAGEDGDAGPPTANVADAGTRSADGASWSDAPEQETLAVDASDAASEVRPSVPEGGGDTGPLDCPVGFQDCNGLRDDGCEAELASDVDHCGACGTPCSADGVTERTCAAGACKPVCDPAHGDCNGNGRDGCEADVANDPDRCGSCDHACSPAHTTERHCTAGACTPLCAPQWGDCTTPVDDDDDGCERSLTRPSDCGACGHGCLGGSCSGGTCQPVVLAEDRTAPRAALVVGSDVYWTEGIDYDAPGNPIRRTPISGGIVVDVVMGEFAYNLATDGQSLYWASFGVGFESIRRAPLSGGTSVEIVPRTFTGLMTPGSVAISGSHLYWLDRGNRKGFRMPLDLTSPPDQFVPPRNAAPNALILDATHAYYTVSGYVERVPLAGGPVAPVGVASTSAIAVNSASVFFHAYDGNTLGISRIGKSLTTPQEVLVPLGGTDKGVLHADDRYVYFAFGNGLYRAPVGGGDRELLSNSNQNITSIATAGPAIYWTASGGAFTTGKVYKLAL